MRWPPPQTGQWRGTPSSSLSWRCGPPAALGCPRRRPGCSALCPCRAWSWSAYSPSHSASSPTPNRQTDTRGPKWQANLLKILMERYKIGGKLHRILRWWNEILMASKGGQRIMQAESWTSSKCGQRIMLDESWMGSKGGHAEHYTGWQLDKFKKWTENYAGWKLDKFKTWAEDYAERKLDGFKRWRGLCWLKAGQRIILADSWRASKRWTEDHAGSKLDRLKRLVKDYAGWKLDGFKMGSKGGKSIMLLNNWMVI